MDLDKPTLSHGSTRLQVVPDGNCGCFTILVLLVLVIVMSVVFVCKIGDTAKEVGKGIEGGTSSFSSKATTY